jgi:hypothetical protein
LVRANSFAVGRPGARAVKGDGETKIINPVIPGGEEGLAGGLTDYYCSTLFLTGGLVLPPDALPNADQTFGVKYCTYELIQTGTLLKLGLK